MTDKEFKLSNPLHDHVVCVQWSLAQLVIALWVTDIDRATSVHQLVEFGDDMTPQQLLSWASGFRKQLATPDYIQSVADALAHFGKIGLNTSPGFAIGGILRPVTHSVMEAQEALGRILSAPTPLMLTEIQAALEAAGFTAKDAEFVVHLNYSNIIFSNLEKTLK